MAEWMDKLIGFTRFSNEPSERCLVNDTVNLVRVLTVDSRDRNTVHPDERQRDADGLDTDVNNRRFRSSVPVRPGAGLLAAWSSVDPRVRRKSRRREQRQITPSRLRTLARPAVHASFTGGVPVVAARVSRR